MAYLSIYGDEMKRVYVPNNKDYDLSDTQRFGPAVIITEGKVNIFNVPELRQLIKVKLADSTESDFLLMGGAPIINALCFGYMLLKNGRVNLLVFNSKDRTYEVRTVTEGDMV